MQSIGQIIAALEAFEPEGDEGADVSRLDELVDGLSELAGGALAMKPIFGLLERYPAAELGSPGPLVHELEAMPGYEGELRASLHRLPVPLTVWMVNRILNSELSERERSAWLSELEAAATHSQSTSASKQEALDFLRRQGSA